MRGDINATKAKSVRPKWIQEGKVTQRWGCDGEREGERKETTEESDRLVGVTVGDDRISIALLSGIVCCSFDKWLENRIRLSEIVVNDIHEQRSIEERLDELESCRTLVVEIRPLVTKFVSLVLPCHKADGFNDCGLHDLLAREHTPCYSIWALGVGIRAEVADSVDDIVSDVCVVFNVREEGGQQVGRNEEFEIRLGSESAMMRRGHQMNHDSPSGTQTRYLDPIRRPYRCSARRLQQVVN